MSQLDARVAALLADLSGEERTALALADWTPLMARGLPYPHYADAGSGLRGVERATAFPAGIALAATFDAELAEAYGAAVGAELRKAGFSVLLGPTLDLARDPRCEVVGTDLVDGDVRINSRVTNAGDRPTVHVAQAYLELAGFDDGPALVGVARVSLGTGESTHAHLLARRDAFLRYDPELQRRAIVVGSHVLRVAVNAADAGQPVSVRAP